jgi:hypothetical protein
MFLAHSVSDIREIWWEGVDWIHLTQDKAVGGLLNLRFLLKAEYLLSI